MLEENLTGQKKVKVLLVSLKGFDSDVVSFIQKHFEWQSGASGDWEEIGAVLNPENLGEPLYTYYIHLHTCIHIYVYIVQCTYICVYMYV